MADQFHSERWHAQRRTCIGGSDAAGIIGASRWSSALSVYLDKVGESAPTPMTSRMEWGTRLEPAIAQWYEDREGVKTRKVGFRRHPEHAFVGGNIDRIRADGRVVEIKCADRLGDEWGEEGSDRIPADYFTQVSHYLMLTGAESADLVVLVRGNDPRVFTIPADPVFQEMLMEEERRFWHEHVIPRIPPPPDGSESSREALSVLYPRSDGEEMVATPEMSAVARNLLDLKATAKSLDRQVTEAENVIKAAMGSRAKMVGGTFRASWSEREGSIGWKTVAQGYRRLLESIRDEEEHPSILADLDAYEGLYRGDPVRSFRVDAVRREEN